MKRKIFNELVQLVPRKEYILITGARQVGKTTVIKQLATTLREKQEEHYFITFEDPDVLNAINKHPENILQFLKSDNRKDRSEKKVILLVDEVQLAADPSNFLKLLYDKHGDWLKIIATGSSAFYLDTKFKDSLAGRKRILELYPLDFDEFLEFSGNPGFREDYRLTQNNHDFQSLKYREMERLYQEYLTYGGYPAVVMEPDVNEKQKILKDLVNTYLKRDVFDSGDSNYLKVVQLLKILAFQTGQMVNVNELSRTLRFALPTIEKYLYILQKCYHIALLRPFFSNIRNEITRMPKVYFHDPGFRNALVNNWAPLQDRADRGQCVENSAYVELRNHHDAENLRFWRTSAGNEIDFIITDGINLQRAIEIKFNGSGWKEQSQKLFLKSYPGVPVEMYAWQDHGYGKPLIRLK